MSTDIAPKVALATLGCKVNQAETEEIAAGLARAGFCRVDFGEPADIYVINTCTVTHVADRKSRNLIRQARRRNERALVVATGCYAEVAPEQIGRLGGVDLVVGNRDKAHLVELIRDACPTAGRPVPAARSRTRAFLKVQDGCDNFCTYCIVPRARGRSRSEPLAAVVAAAQARLAEGCREIVLTGVHVGAYGRDRAGKPRQRNGGPESVGLADLLRALLTQTGVERIRLSSLEPEDLGDELLALWREHPDRLCRHFHLPLQSGSDDVLRRMGRRYQTADYAALVERVRAAVPDVAVTTDLMVGFPGEGEAEHRASYEFVRAMRFAGVHVFRYSPRPGTPAARLPEQVPAAVAKARSEEMLALAAAQARDFRARLVGRTLPVLFEEKVTLATGSWWTGLTDNYVRVYAPSAAELANEIRLARLCGVEQDGLVGSVLS